MSIQSGPQKSSCNSGEFSPDLYGKIGLKDYYNAGKRFKGVEPVPQAGFRLMPGTALVETARSRTVRQYTLPVSSSLSYTLFFSVGYVDIFRNDRVKVASLALSEITAGLLPELEFYAEAATVGIFHEDLESLRLVRDGGDDTVWTKDTWPYAKIPEVDLGGNYAKTDDKWEVLIRHSDGSVQPAFRFTIDGEPTAAIELGATFSAATDTEWDTLASDIETALEGLPSLGATITVTHAISGGYRQLTITFGGDLSGSEYDVVCECVNASSVATLTYHTVVGETAGEALVSASKGWFSGMALAQDRAVYYRPKARKAALNMSRTGEYFDLNIEAVGNNAARLEALRTQTSEEIMAVLEAHYVLAWTDKGLWFASNRTIKQDEPLNWVKTGKNGIAPHVPPAELDGQVVFVGGETESDNPEDTGQSLYSAEYDDVSTRWNDQPESLLSSHLIEKINGAAVQNKVRKNDASRWWLPRSDGRLICCLRILTQKILAVVEWCAADAGEVTGVSVDGQNQVWLTVDRGGVITHEVMEEQEINLFQGAVRGSTDLAGLFSGLDIWEGRQVWARADGFILGPFTVNGGSIDLEDPYDEVIAGLWQAPEFESMPYYKVTRNDEIIERPGRIHSATISVIATESIAVGANGSTPRDVPLLKTTDPVDAPLPAKTEKLRVIGIPGTILETSLTITQTRPGMLRVRDFTPEAKL